MVRRESVFIGLALLLLTLHAARVLLVGDTPLTQLQFGAYQGRSVADGQVWRLATYALVHRDWTQVILNALAVAVLGTVLVRVHSLRLALFIYALGVMLGVLSFALFVPPSAILVSVSAGPAALVGAVLVTFLFQPARLGTALAYAAAVTSGVFLMFSTLAVPEISFPQIVAIISGALVILVTRLLRLLFDHGPSAGGDAPPPA